MTTAPFLPHAQAPRRGLPLFTDARRLTGS